MKENASLKNDGPRSASREVDRLLFEWNSEIISLYNKRMQEYCMLPFSLLTCTSPDDLEEVQSAFLETLRVDYRASAERLGQMLQGDRGAEASGHSYSEALLKAQDDARAILDQAKAQAKRIVAEAEARVRPEAHSANGSAAAAA